MIKQLSFIFLCINLLSVTSDAFPELVRHGYSSCLACHVSPTGGGVLNSYGRELSREVLSTWGGEKESQSAYGVLPLPEWLELGGDYRLLQVVQSDANQERALLFNMQTDIEAAISFRKMFVAGVFGKDTRRSSDSEFTSRRHYAGYRVNDNILIRAGKFFPEFGLNVSNHRRVTRLFYGFDQGQETYNLEGSWANETLGLFVTGVFGRPFEDSSLVNSIDQSGVSLSGHVFLWDTSRLGASLRIVSGNNVSSQNFDAFAVLGFSKKLFLMGEFVLGNSENEESGTSDMSFANFSRLNWEVIRGVHVYGIQEFRRADVDDSDSDTVGFGGGLQFFPRPHFEFASEFQVRRTSKTISFSENLFTFLMHFYL